MTIQLIFLYSLYLKHRAFKFFLSVTAVYLLHFYDTLRVGLQIMRNSFRESRIFCIHTEQISGLKNQTFLDKFERRHL